MSFTASATISEPNEEDIDGLLIYPQPSPYTEGAGHGLGSKPYRYLRYETSEENCFPEHAHASGDLPPDTLVWVLLSKGKNKVPQLHKRARVCDGIADGDGRILVRYPSGSTYRVRRKNLVPVLEYQTQTIVVAAETNDYRRMSIVHTRQEDHFIEIGCDFGILVDKVDAKSTLGIDKSEESIKIAREQYPNQEFFERDVFEEDNTDILERLHKDDGDGLYHKGGEVHNLVVSIDINGNRELPAVLRCIQMVLDSWSPRLIMVKSRALHAKMVASENGDNTSEKRSNKTNNKHETKTPKCLRYKSCR